MPPSTTMVGRTKVRASSSRQPRPLVRVRLHRSRDGSPPERLRERRCGSGPIRIYASLPQSSGHSREPAGVVLRFEPRRVCFWLQFVQLLYEALECDRCHRTPSVTCPCSSWWTLSLSGYGRERRADSSAAPPFLNTSVGVENGPELRAAAPTGGR